MKACLKIGSGRVFLAIYLTKKRRKVTREVKPPKFQPICTYVLSYFERTRGEEKDANNRIKNVFPSRSYNY